jgi:Cys-rich protein (TIGR01571 family)
MIEVPPESRTGRFETGLFDCCEHSDVVCQVLFCTPCVVSQSWADSRGEPCDCCYFLCCHASLWTRTNIRHARGMAPSYCADCCVHCGCLLCALCQEYEEARLLAAQRAPLGRQ